MTPCAPSWKRAAELHTRRAHAPPTHHNTAGAGITAELLTKAGLNVVIVEEGPLKSSTDFKQLEPEAYASLYQENAGRKTKDKGITILQGRSVGGTTTVNWTSSFARRRRRSSSGRTGSA